MIDAYDGTSVNDSKNLLLEKGEFIVVWRREEQPGDLQAYEGLMISGGVGMTHCDFASQGFQIICLQVR